MSAESPERTPNGLLQLITYVCFGFSASVAIFVGLLLVLAWTSPSNPEHLGALLTMSAILLVRPAVGAAGVGVILSLVLRKPRSLLLLAGLTVLEFIFLVYSDRLPIDRIFPSPPHPPAA